MKSKKIYISVVSVLLVITIIALGVYFGIYGVKNNTQSSFDNKEEEVKENIVAIDRMGNPIAGNSVIPMQSFAYTCAETNQLKSVFLEAKVEPANATDKTVVWSINWKNDKSSFAVGKKVTDYVSIIPGEDTSSCEVKYVKDFGEQVIITATVKADSNISTNCTVDCCQKYKYKSMEYDCNNIKINLDKTTIYTVDYLPTPGEIVSDSGVLFAGRMAESIQFSGLEQELVAGIIPVEFTLNKDTLQASCPYKEMMAKRFGKNGKTYEEITQILANKHFKGDILLGIVTGKITTKYYSFEFTADEIIVPYDTWRVKASGITINSPSIKI